MVILIVSLYLFIDERFPFISYLLVYRSVGPLDVYF
jgi:hypothetical protein